jgi:MFS family permease
MQGVCATVLVFSALIGVLGQYADAFGLSQTAGAALFGLLELSTGVAEASALPNTEIAAVLCAAMAGWAGLSVHCQILSVCDGCPISLVPFWLSRLLQGLVCGGGMWLALHIGLLDVPCAMPDVSVDAWRQPGLYGNIWQAICIIGFLVATAIGLTVKRGGERHEAKTIGRTR